MLRRALVVLFLVSAMAQAADHPKKFEKTKFHFDQTLSPGAGAGLTVFQISDPVSAKSKKKAVLFSLIVPGLGEWYLNGGKFDTWGSGKYFFGAEFLMWAGHFYFHSYSRWVESDARSLAAQYAGVDVRAPKPSRYYINVGKFSDIYSYNETQRRLTGTENLYAETQNTYWRWDGASHQNQYERMRISSRQHERYAQYLYYGIFINHILSAINTARVYKENQKNHTYGFHVDVIPNLWAAGARDYEIRVGLSKHF